MIFTINSFANDNSNSSMSLEKVYRDSLFSVIKFELDIEKADIVKDKTIIENINEYIDNSIALEISIDEFISILKSEIKANNSRIEDSKDEFLKYLEYSKSFVSREYDVSKEKLNTSEFEDYVKDVVDEYNEKHVSKDFEELFKKRIEEDFKGYNKMEIFIKVLITLVLLVFLGFLLSELMMGDSVVDSFVIILMIIIVVIMLGFVIYKFFLV